MRLSLQTSGLQGLCKIGNLAAHPETRPASNRSAGMQKNRRIPQSRADHKQFSESTPMRRTLNVVLGLLFLTSAAAASAQGPSGPAGPQQQAPPPGGEARGSVVDGDANTPIAKAQITVRNKAGALVTGAITREDGQFRIQGLRPGAYYLRVTLIGYGPVSTPEFTVTPASLNADLGTIKLSKVAVALSDVQVKAERDAVTIEPDRSSYKAKDVAATANNASEVLDHVPSVTVDGDGKVSLRGNENVVVQAGGTAPFDDAMAVGAPIVSFDIAARRLDQDIGEVDLFLADGVRRGPRGGALDTGVRREDRLVGRGGVGLGAAPTLIPGVVFEGAGDGRLFAVSSTTGKLLWQFNTRQEFKTLNEVMAHGGAIASSGAVVVDGMVFVGSGYAITDGATAGNVLLAFGLD